VLNLFVLCAEVDGVVHKRYDAAPVNLSDSTAPVSPARALKQKAAPPPDEQPGAAILN